MDEQTYYCSECNKVCSVELNDELNDDTNTELDEIISVQCRDGNWNHSPYMHGLTNGLILARALLTDTDPEYLDTPKVWKMDEDEENSHE